MADRLAEAKGVIQATRLQKTPALPAGTPEYALGARWRIGILGLHMNGFSGGFILEKEEQLDHFVLIKMNIVELFHCTEEPLHFVVESLEHGGNQVERGKASAPIIQTTEEFNDAHLFPVNVRFVDGDNSGSNGPVGYDRFLKITDVASYLFSGSLTLCSGFVGKF